MQKKSTKPRKTRREERPPTEWNLLDTSRLELRYNYGNSVVAEFVAGHDHADVLRELVQNEYDAGGSRLQVAFGTDELRILGNGNPIDADGWRRLSVMLGTGQVGRSERTIAQKVNGIGSKNFGLRSLFLYGDQIYIRSGGLQTVLDFSLGTLPEPKPEPGSNNLQGIEIVVPYRKRKGNGLEPFDTAHERKALESFATDLTSVLMKLAQPETPKSLRQVEISSERGDRSLVLKQTVAVLLQQKGITILRRAIHLDDSRLSGSEVNRHTVEEVEFQKAFPLPQQYRDQAIPGYFKVPGGRIRLAVSMRKHRKKIDIEQPGYYFYPLGAAKAYTGNAISINAPFQVNTDRSQILDPNIVAFNAWLLDRATDLTFDLLTSYWWHEFGPDSYLALQKQTDSATTYFMEKVADGLEKHPCWPTRVHHKGAKRPQLTSATEIVVPDHPALDGFLPDAHYLEETLANNLQIRKMAKECGAKVFGISSLVRLRCAGSDKTQLATKLAKGEAGWEYTDFPDALKAESLQRKFANAFDALAAHLSQQNREDLKRSPTTLAADGTLQAPEKLWVVDPAIASASPIPPSERLHPILAECKVLVRLCNKYDTKKWISKTAQHVQDGTASEDQRNALYRFVLETHGHLDRKTWGMLRKTQVLRDHRNDWVMPKTITLRKAIGASQLEVALHFPHPDYENDKELAEALHFKKKVTGEDIVRYAHIVVTRPDLAQEFEETLQRFSKLLTKQELEQLRTFAFLQSSQGRLASPSTLYLRTPHNVACLGDDARFVAGPRTALYKRLGCMEQPKMEDILNYLSRLRLQGIKPNQPEILYPTLAEALRAVKRLPLLYQNQPIIWDGTGYSKPGDILLGNKYYRPIFLQAVPLLEEASPKLRQALKSLGVPSEPQPQHWQRLFVWFHQRYAHSGEPLTRFERHRLHQAYSHLSEIPKGVTDDIKCLLDQDGRLHSLTEMRAKLYLLNDDPALAQALIEQGTPLAFADIQDSQQAADLRFYHRLGISLLTEVREQIGCRIGAEIMPPPWYVSESAIEKLHDHSFLSALRSLAAYQLQEQLGSSDALIPLLQEVRALVFAHPLHIVYQVGRVSIPVPTDVVLDHERIVLAEVQSLNELDELLSQAIAGLFIRTPAEQRQFADAVYRLLTCSLPSEMEKYLTRRGIPWKPPSSMPQAEVTHLYEEFSNDVTNFHMEPEATVATINDEELKDHQIVQEVIKSSITSRLSTSYTTSNTISSPDLKERESNLTQFSTSKLELPPIESVTPVRLEPLNGWSPQDSNASGVGRKGYWISPTPVDEERKTEVGQRGEEIVFLQEVDRVKRLGYPDSRVVWVAKDNPMADFDILSVDENGRDLWLEVKSTTGRHGHFQWSVDELKKAMQEREQYILWRVYEVGTTHPSIKPFRDPVGMIIRHGIQLDVASLSAEVEPLRVAD